MGIGIECQNVTFYALIALWFTEKEHGMASAVSAMMIRLGMVSAEFCTPLVQEHYEDLTYPFGLTTTVAFCGLLCGSAVVLMDRVNQRRCLRFLKRQDTLEKEYLQRHANDLGAILAEQTIEDTVSR